MASSQRPGCYSVPATLLLFLRRVMSAALLCHVSEVVRLRSQEQVIGSNARRIIAVVANVHAFRYWPVSHLVGHPMGVYKRPHAQPDLPVPMGVAGTHPLPATVALGDLVPEAVLNGTLGLVWPSSTLDALRTWCHQNGRASSSSSASGISLKSGAGLCSCRCAYAVLRWPAFSAHHPVTRPSLSRHCLFLQRKSGAFGFFLFPRLS